MANKERYEFDVKIGGKTYTMVFRNRDHMAAEDLLGMDGDMLEQRVGRGMGKRIRTALVWGGTRKYHENDIPDMDTLDDVMTDFTDQLSRADDPEKAADDLLFPILGAYLRRTPQELKDERARQIQGRKDDGPKDQDKPTRKPKPKAVKNEDAA